MTDVSNNHTLNGKLKNNESIKKIEAGNLLSIKSVLNLAFGIFLLLFLFIISRQNYLLFHTFAELFSITIAWSLFILVWNTRHLTENKAIVFIGIAYLFVGLIDLVHTLSFKGMNVMAADLGANPATQLWIAGRLVESISLLLFPLLFFKHLRHHVILIVYAIITALVFYTIFYWKIFPDCYVEGVGLTLFKKNTEYIICLILLTAGSLLYRIKSRLDPTVYRLMAFSIILTIFGELSFTRYEDVYGLSNLTGHYFKILSYFFIYLALVRLSLKKPYLTLFKDLNESEKKFKSLFNEMISGIALHEIICDEAGKPIDYRFLNINPAFEKMTGLKDKDLKGKTVTEVLPDTEAYWIETYGQVALTGNPIQFENFSKELNKHFEVKAYCPKVGQFVSVFNDITDKKAAENNQNKLINELKKAANEIKSLKGIIPICSHCKKIRDDTGYWNILEAYIQEHSDAELSHSICPDCAEKYYPDLDIYAD